MTHIEGQRCLRLTLNDEAIQLQASSAISPRVVYDQAFTVKYRYKPINTRKIISYRKLKYTEKGKKCEETRRKSTGNQRTTSMVVLVTCKGSSETTLTIFSTTTPENDTSSCR